MKKRILKFLQSPGALVALVIYTLLAVLRIISPKNDHRVKEWFMASIPFTALAVWGVAVFYVVRWLW